MSMTPTTARPLLASLAGRIAYIYMTDKKLGKQLLAALSRV